VQETAAAAAANPQNAGQQALLTQQFGPMILQLLPGMRDLDAVAARVVTRVAAAAAAAAESEPAFSSMRRGFFNLVRGKQQPGAAAAVGARAGSTSREELQVAVQRVWTVLMDLERIQKDAMPLNFPGTLPGASNITWSQVAAKFGCSEDQLGSACTLLHIAFLFLGLEESVMPPASPQPAVDATMLAVMRSILGQAAAPRILIQQLEMAAQQGSGDQLLQLLQRFPPRAPSESGLQPQARDWVVGAGAGAGAGFEDDLGDFTGDLGDFTGDLTELGGALGEGGGVDLMDWEGKDVLRLRGGGRGSSSVATEGSSSECEQQLPASPVRQRAEQQQPRGADSGLLARLQQRRRQQQQLRVPISVVEDDESGTDTLSPTGPGAYLSPTAAAAAEAADAGLEGGSDVCSSGSGGDTDVMVAVAAAGSRARTQGHRVTQQQMHSTLQQQQEQQEVYGGQEEQEGSAASSPQAAAAAANQAPGFDVFATAAAASSSRQLPLSYSWQEYSDQQQQFHSEQLPGLDQLQGQVTFGCPSGLDVANADAGADADAEFSDLQDDFGSEGAVAGSGEQYYAAAALQQGSAGSWHDAGSEDEQWQQLPGRPDLLQRLQSLVNSGTAAAAAAAEEDADAWPDAELGSDSGSDGCSGSYRSVFGSEDQPLVDSIFYQAELRRLREEADLAAAGAAAGPGAAAAAAATLQRGPRRPLWGPAEQGQVQQLSDRQRGGLVNESSSGSDSYGSGLSHLLTQDFATAFVNCAKDWDRIQQLGGPLKQHPQQQQQWQPPPPLPLAAAEVQAFQPSQQQQYFAVAGEEAVRGWIGLLVSAASTSRTVRSHVAK
jgi:hypothetical protein